MAQAADPQSKSRIGSVFQLQLAALVKYALAAEEAARGNGPRQWYTPGVPSGVTWSGNPLDLTALHPIFSRDEQGEQWAATVADANASGNVGDLMSIQAQGDWMQMLERAYHSRHMTSVRAKAHAAARDRGHAAPRGVLQLGVLGHIQHLDKQAKNG